MKAMQMTTSVALFYCSDSEDAVPFAWFEQAVEIFNTYRLSPILFTAAGGHFEFDDCYLLADGGGKVYRWGDPMPIRPRRSRLIDALRNGAIYSLSLDTPRADSKSRSDWRAKLSASSVFGDFYIGLDEELVGDLVNLIRSACQVASGLFDIRYGFAYKMPLADDPDCYAIGSRSLSWSEVKQWIRRRNETPQAPPTADQLWRDEHSKRRRHLTGLFRGVYRANVLSESHVNAAELRSSPIGKLSEINDALWLWEVSDEEMPIAETMLRAKGVDSQLMSIGSRNTQPPPFAGR
jgi:hypothetical protein